MGDQRHDKQTSLNIAALVPYTVYPAKMGGQKGIALFYQYLSEKLAVTIISTRDNEFPAKTPAQYLDILGTSKYRYINPWLFFCFRKLIREKSFSHLVLEHPYFGWLGILLKWTTQVKLVVHSHNIEALRFRSTGKWWWGILWHYEKWVHRIADTSFFISEEDRQYAITRFKADPARCHTITYGIEIPAIPSDSDRREARRKLESAYHIGPDEKILLFNGTLDYKPNTDALEAILRQISPLLDKTPGYRYRILICGKNLPERFKTDQAGYLAEHVQYAGFVDNIRTFFLGADVFLNPVTDGGGIKTKLVEALGYNLTAVSSLNGAIGVDPGLSPGKLLVADHADWEGFARMIREANLSENTSPAFFNHFYWANIADKAANILRTSHR